MKIHNFKELNVWKKSIDLAALCYEITSSFPKDERFGLTSQIQRAAVSIASNIAEGCGRVTNNELRHSLSISMGSCYEVETQIILALKFGYLSETKFNEFQVSISEVQKMLFGFYNSLK